MKETLETKGVIHSKAKESYNERQQKFEKFLNAITSLGEPLQLEIPKMVEEKPPEEPKVSISLDGNLQNNEELGVWDDKETADFYENLPDLRTEIPLVLLGLDQSSTSTSPSTKSTLPTTSPSSQKETTSNEEKNETSTEFQNLKLEEASLNDMESESEKKEEIEEVKSSMGDNNVSFLQILSNLQNCSSKESIDKATIDFCYVNTKKSRKVLTEELYKVPKNRLELIPYYSRMVATLNQYFPKLSDRLLTKLINEFFFLVKSGSNNSPFFQERKSKAIKFLSELTKFKVCPIDKTFYFFQICFENYSLSNIEMVCFFLENIGRFLFKSPETHVRTKLILETLLRLKQIHNIKGPLEITIDNAYFQCNPPTSNFAKSKQRSPKHQYIRHLLFKQIQSVPLSNIVLQLRKINWKEDGNYIMKSLYKVSKLKFNQIKLISQIVSKLLEFHPEHCIQFLDNLLDNLQNFLESKSKQNSQQSQLMNIKLIAHLFTSNFFESPLLFSILYAIIEFGVTNVFSTQDSFRVRMACILLEIVVPSLKLNTPSLKKILNLYLLYFQRYVLSLRHISLDLQFQVNDLYSLLEKYKLLTSKPFQSLSLLSQHLQSQLSTLFPNAHLTPSPSEGKEHKVVVSSQSLPNLPPNPENQDQKKELSEEEKLKLEIEKKEEELKQKKLREIEERKKKEEFEKQQKEHFENELRMMISSSFEERKKQESKINSKERSLIIPLSLLKDLEEEKNNPPLPSHSYSLSPSESGSENFPSLKSKKSSSKKSKIQEEDHSSEEDLDDEENDEAEEQEEPVPTKKIVNNTQPIKAQKFRVLVRPNKGGQKTLSKPLFIPEDSNLVVKHNHQKQVQLKEKNELAQLVIASANRLGQDEESLDITFNNPLKPPRKKNFYEDYDPSQYTNDN